MSFGWLVEVVQSGYTIVWGAVITLIISYAKVRKSILFEDILYMHPFNRNKKRIQEIMDSGLLDKIEKSEFLYELKKMSYQKCLKLSASLPIMQELQRYENVEDAVFRFKVCRDQLIFDVDKQEFTSKKTFDLYSEKRALKKRWIGISIFAFMNVCSYLICFFEIPAIKMNGFLKLGIYAVWLILIFYISFQILKWFVKDIFLFDFINNPPAKKHHKQP